MERLQWAQRAVCALVFVFAALAPTAQPYDGQNVQVIGRIGGWCDRVQVQGNFAYINEGPGLRVLDLGNPAAPTARGGATLEREHVTGFHVSGNHAYVVSNGLHVIDVGDPDLPVVVGRLWIDMFPEGVFESNGLAYIIGSRLDVVDVSDPLAPSPLGRTDDVYGSDIIVVGSHAFVNSWEVLKVVDVSDPAQPRLVNSADVTGTMQDIRAVGNLLYCACSMQGLVIFDVTDPTSPVLRGTYPTQDWAKGVFVSNDLAYIAIGAGGLEIANVTNPADPTWVASLPLPNYASRVWLTGNIACVAGETMVMTVDVANPAQPVLIGRYPTLGLAEHVRAAGSLAYVLDPDSGLHAYDVSTPSRPQLVGSWWGFAHDFAIEGQRAYLADGDLIILDISDPASPTQIGWASTPGNAVHVQVSGNLACLGDPGPPGGIEFLDVTVPADVQLVGFYGTRVRDFVVVPPFLYVAAETDGLRILDIADPSSPVLVGTYPARGGAKAIAVSGPRAYMIDTTFGGPDVLDIVDVSRPAQPLLLGRTRAGLMANAILVDGAVAYVASFSGFRAFGMVDPALPRLAAYLPGFGSDLAASGDYVFCISDGLMILQLEGPRIQAATLSDLNANGMIEGGDQLVLTLDQSVIVNPQVVLASHFFLPVAGDSLGDAGFAVGVNAFNPRQIVLTLGSGATLTAAGPFDLGAVAPGSPSGIDFSADLPPSAVTNLDGLPARDGGQPDLDDSGVDLELSMIGSQRTVGPSGGTISVVNSPEAAYRRHQLAVPAGALATTATFQLRPPSENLGVIGAVEIVTSPPGVTFDQPVRLRLSYREGDVPLDLGFLIAELRVCQLTEVAPGVLTYQAVPGVHTLDPLREQISAPLDALLHIRPPQGHGKFQSTLPVFAGIPIETVDERSVNLKPSGGPGIIKGQGSYTLAPGPLGAYTEHRIEFPDYQETTPDDPARLVVTICQATAAEKTSLTGGQSFPANSGALFVVTVKDAAGQPVAFTDPVRITVQFKERTPAVLTDVVRFSGLLGNPAYMGLVHDATSGSEVDFAFLGVTPQTVNTAQGTVRVENVIGLTDDTGAATYGAVAHDYLTRAERWTLYR